MSAPTTATVQDLEPLPASPFDAMAAEYDAAFSRSRIGSLMRRAVQRRMDARFRAGDRILELNCGTGEDAVYLAKRGIRVLATDVSREMTAIARAKTEAHGLTGQIEVRPLAIEALDSLARNECGRKFDGALSNFGGLNCVAERQDAASALGKCVRPGGFALVCVMGPVCLWEWGWYLLQGRPDKAFRRLRPGGVAWRGLKIRYPSLRQIRRDFAPYFHCARVSAVGALLPPTFAEAWAARHLRLLTRLDTWERRFETWPILAWCADHYLMELQRTETEVSLS